MSILLQPIFWLSQLLTVVLLTGAGVLIAHVVVPKPPTYQRTTYFEFALPPGWGCEREGTETVCRPDGPPPHDAIIIFTAKIRNAEDNLAAYKDHVSKPQKRTERDGVEHTSEVIRYNERAIGEYHWIDALHLGSEAANYYTRYLATTTAQIGMLITFSAHKSVLEERTKEFKACVESLRIHQSPSRYN
jgi:hypothetical protein